MISAANLGQECLLINQDKNHNKNNVSCRLVSIEFTNFNSPDVSGDVTTNSPDVSDDVTTNSPDVSDDVTTNIPDVSDDVITDNTKLHSSVV